MAPSGSRNVQPKRNAEELSEVAVASRPVLAPQQSSVLRRPRDPLALSVGMSALHTEWAKFELRALILV